MRFSKTKNLLGTLVEVTVVSEDPKTPDRIEYIFDYFSSVEEEFSRFRSDSALSRLNREKICKVSSRFVTLMKLCRQKYDETGGLFNPLVHVARLGYGQSFEKWIFEPCEGNVDMDFGQVLIGTDTVSLGKDQILDLGGIAKWYAVDMASAMLLALGYDDFFVNAGGDIYAHGMNEEKAPWVIGIENPFSLAVDISVSLKNSAVATSGRYKRKWQMDGKEYHHLVNPLTGRNESGIASVTLIGKKCVDCDSFTKSIFHLSPEEGMAKIREKNMEGLIYTQDRYLVYTSGLLEKHGIIFAKDGS